MSSSDAIAVVGAGIAGLTLAQKLKAAGRTVRLFDKGRSPGGRMCVRREGEWSFDHGGQYFTCRDPRFLEQTKRWIDAGVAAKWNTKLIECGDGFVSARHDPTERFVGVPAMNAVVKDLAAGLDISTGAKIVRTAHSHRGWTVEREDGLVEGPFAALAIAVPAPQAAELLQPVPGLATLARQVVMEACWTVMCAFEEDFSPPFDAGFPLGTDLAWISCNSSKPGRLDQACWILQGAAAWSRAHIEDVPERVAEHLLGEFFKAICEKPRRPLYARAHRWRYAQPVQPLKLGCLWDPGLRIGACGDWCEVGRVEGAYLSGLGLAERMLAER